MRARDIMTTEVVTVRPETTVRDIAKLMIERRIGGVPVVDASGNLLGIVTDGDLYRRAELGTARRRRNWLEIFGFDTGQAQDFAAAHAHTAADVMSPRVYAVTPQTSARQIADLLERRRIHRVPVVIDRNVVGIVSRANLVRALASAPVEDTRVNLSDQRVRDLVIAEYRRLPSSMPSETNVLVSDGVVHLWGWVPSGAEFDALRIAAEGVPGVKGFRDHSYRAFGEAGGPQGKRSEVIIEEPADLETENTST